MAGGGSDRDATPAAETTPPPWAAPDGDTRLILFATCPQGIEPLLAEEIVALGGESVSAGSAGVHWSASWAVVERVNRGSRLASRVLLRLAAAPYRNERDILRLVADVPWEQAMTPDHTLRVDLSSRRARLKSLRIVTLRIKDAIVDRLRERFGRRPDVDTQDPDVRVMAFVDEREAAIYLDLSGESLFKRGWRGRLDKGAAPLKENLAAALPLLAGWRPGEPLLDPFCGSGTIVIEAAQRLAGLAPGAHRAFGFERLAGYRRPSAPGHEGHPGGPAPAPGDPSPDGPAPIFASDIDSAIVRVARENARRAGLDSAAIRFAVADAFTVKRPPHVASGWIVTNPPYGERLDEIGDAERLLALGRRWRDEFSGWRLAWLTADHGLPGRLGLRARRRIPVMNGALDCRLFVFDLGSVGPAPERP